MGESKRLSGMGGRSVRLGIVFMGVLALSAFSHGVARAQGTSANRGAMTFTGSVDVPSVFVFRGLVQEDNPRLTFSPAVDVGIALGNGLTANLGVWHSLHTGDAGLDGFTGRLHYREDFYASLGLPLGQGLRLSTTYAALTSPNFLFNTVQELSFKVTSASRFAPHALVAFELSGAADDIDRGTGSYLELGLGPNYRLGPKAILSIPVKVGLSLSNYYEDFTGDERFGFFSAGGLVTYPLGGAGRFGAWQLRGGADFYRFGDTTKGRNADNNGEVSSSTIVARVGIGVTY